MIRKTLVTAGAVTLAMMLFFGRDAASYLGTTFGWVKDSVKNNVPIEFEIERARRMVKDLVPDIRKNMHVIAQEEVEVDRLEKQIAQTNATLDHERTDIMRLKNDLSTNQVSYQYGGRTYSVSQVKCDLSNRFERFKTHEATLASLQEMQAARRKSLDAARQKLEGMLASRRQLEVDVENLEARFKMIEVAQTTSQYNIDDSQLGRVKELIGDLRARLNVAERIANSSADFNSEIPLSPAAADDIVDQVTEYFQSSSNTAIADATAVH
jgi:predicted  nucleic acid-binding Zn-ribbon protein